MRKVILHYHLFKNAGSSTDVALKEYFNSEEGGWLTKEFSSDPEINRKQVKDWIINNKYGKCFSSHTALLPPPEIEGVKVIPVIFFRHPIDRIASAYSFERKQVDFSFGSVLARNTDLAGYVETRLALENDRQCENFHVDRFAFMFDEIQGNQVKRAKMAVTELPFVGLVEKYSESLKLLNKLLISEGFGNIDLTALEENTSDRVSKNLNEKLLAVRLQLGDELYSKLLKVNHDDIAIWEYLML